MKEFKFNWGYALHKLLVWCTSTANLAIVVPVVYALTNYQIPENVQAAIVLIASFVLSMIQTFKKD